MEVVEAFGKLKEKVKTLKDITECRDYGNKFIFVAFETDDHENEIDPFYSVDKRTGDVKKFDISGDPGKFFSSPTLNFKGGHK